MMLRVLVVVLLLGNLGFWAWHSGLLDGVGLGPARERDPWRRAQQVRPESLRILPSTVPAPSPLPAAPADAAASVRASTASVTATVALASQVAASLPGLALPGVCLEAGPWVASAAANGLGDGAEQAERALASVGVPSGSWQRVRQDVTAQYAVVLGPFSGRESVQAKREELARLRLVGEEIALRPEGSAASAALRPGLALGRYDTRSTADAGLASYNQRGVRTARVAQLRSAGTEIRLRVAAASPALAEQLRRLSGPGFGLGFQPCEAAR